jgi:hypothetical protein
VRWIIPLLLLIPLAACDDDDTVPCGCPDDLWVEQSLPSELTNGGIWGLDARAGRTVALAATGGGSFVIEEGSGGWDVVGGGALPGTEPGSLARTVVEPPRVGAGITVDSRGKIQVVGALIASVKPVVWSEVGESWTAQEVEGSGFLQDVVPLGGRDILAAGTGSSGIPVVTGSAGTEFVFDTVSLGGEAGLTALVEESGVIYGCGFNDAADGTAEDPYRIVMQYAGGQWERIPSPCVDCGSFDFRAIAATPSALYLGGSARVRPAGDPSAPVQEQALLLIWSFSAEEWTQIVLPDAFGLQRVNAILTASEGAIYVACGSPDTPAYLIRAAPGRAPEIEKELAGIRLFSLAETGDGRILAAGLEPGEVEGIPVLLER